MVMLSFDRLRTNVLFRIPRELSIVPGLSLLLTEEREPGA